MPARIWRSPHLHLVDLLQGIDVQVSVSRHFHEEYQIGLVHAGALDLRLPAPALRATPRQIFIIPPGEVHTSDSARD